MHVLHVVHVLPEFWVPVRPTQDYAGVSVVSRISYYLMLSCSDFCHIEIKTKFYHVFKISVL